MTLLTTPLRFLAAPFALLALSALTAKADTALNQPPPGYTALFNGKDLTGWFGHKGEDPRNLFGKSAEELEKIYADSMADVNAHWTVQNGELVNDGHGLFLTTKKLYRDFEFMVEYKTVPLADSGIYLRGCPQVQIWDTTEEGKFNLGADKGSGGLWNNSPGAPGKDPSKKMDKPFGEWNSFKITMIGERVTVVFNGEKVVDNAVLENYNDRKSPIFAQGPLKLQTHGNEIRWRNIFIKELDSDSATAALRGNAEGYTRLDNGKDLSNWGGAADNYEVHEGAIRCKPGKGGVLHTKEEYADFNVRLEFKLPPAGNNGLAIRYPGKGDTAYTGMTEIQVLDTEDKAYATIDPRQACGSVYGMIAAKRGFLRPTGEWNYYDITVKGSTIRVQLNGTTILDGDVAKVDPATVMHNSPHPGKDRTTGFFGFAGHGDAVEFRNVFIKKL